MSRMNEIHVMCKLSLCLKTYAWMVVNTWWTWHGMVHMCLVFAAHSEVLKLTGLPWNLLWSYTKLRFIHAGVHNTYTHRQWQYLHNSQIMQETSFCIGLTWKGKFSILNHESVVVSVSNPGKLSTKTLTNEPVYQLTLIHSSQPWWCRQLLPRLGSWKHVSGRPGCNTSSARAHTLTASCPAARPQPSEPASITRPLGAWWCYAAKLWSP